MKVPCKTCGVQILPATANDNDGNCVPCAKGYRSSIEESKIYYAAQKEAQKKYDPEPALWLDLLKRSEGNDLSTFSDDEKLYFTVCILEGEVYNGGFHQFFFNSSGDHFEVTLNGLETLKAYQCKEIAVEAARAVFGFSHVPKDRQERWDALKAFDERIGLGSDNDPLEALDRRFWSDPDDLSSLLVNFARNSGLIEPFLEEKQN